MAATTFGTAHLYGIAAGTGAITNATVLDFKMKDEHSVKESTVDETGKEIERRYDDEHNEGSITLRMRSAYTKPAPASTLVYQSVTYEVVSVERSETSRGYRVITLAIKKSEGVSYT